LRPASVARMTSSAASEAVRTVDELAADRIVAVDVDDALFPGIALGGCSDAYCCIGPVVDCGGSRKADQREADSADARELGVCPNGLEEVPACGCGVFEPEMRPRHFRQDARFLCAISDRFEGCERLTVQIERVDEVVTARRELGESTEGDAGSFVVAEPPLNRKCVLGLLRCGLGVSLESVGDP